MKYDEARYLSAASYSNAEHSQVCDYFSSCISDFDTSLVIEALFHDYPRPTSKFRRQRFSEEKIEQTVARAQSSGCQALGIYVSSQDFTDESAPAFQANLHLSFRDDFEGKRIEERPRSFMIVAVRVDQPVVMAMRQRLISPIPGLLRGGIWEHRLYDEHGAAIVWAYKNYPVPKSRCSLADWTPNFDLEFRRRPNQPPEPMAGLAPGHGSS